MLENEEEEEKKTEKKKSLQLLLLRIHKTNANNQFQLHHHLPQHN